MVSVIANFITEDECNELIATFESAEKRISYGSNELVWWTEFVSRKVGFWRETISRSLETLSKTYSVEGLAPESLFLARLQEGGAHAEHSDNSTFKDGQWVPNHTPFRAFTSLIYLNDNFCGGEICFKQHDLKLRPRPGMWIGFPANEDYLHEVLQLKKGARYSVAMWFTLDISRSFQL